MRSLSTDAYKTVALGDVSGLCVHTDSSPMRTYGLGGVAGCNDALVKSVRIVNGDGAMTPLAPRACLPCVFVQVRSLHTVYSYRVC